MIYSPPLIKYTVAGLRPSEFDKNILKSRIPSQNLCPTVVEPYAGYVQSIKIRVVQPAAIFTALA